MNENFIIIGVCLAYVGFTILLVKLINDFRRKLKQSLFNKKETKVIKHPATIAYEEDNK
jgi:hypothetical protein